MPLFIIGLVILVVGGALYGRFVEKVFGPDDRKTPALSQTDGVDYVPMGGKRNMLIELLNIAGTGPIIGPIQGILFGPVAFLAIPLGCVLAGALHDYFIGMISMRNNGAQVPKLMQKYMGTASNRVYNIVIWVLMLLTGVVFIYTPGDLIVSDILGMDVNSNVIWIVYAVILAYYIVATLFPIDKIIGRVYPVFGALLIISAVGVFIGVLRDGGASLHSMVGTGLLMQHPAGMKFIPVFFITVACGILSGFHGSQATLISRTVTHEKDGRGVFYNMMIAEGFIAMCWAAGAMVVFNRGVGLDTAPTLMVGEISRMFMGRIGGLFAIAGVIILPITSGDTAFRALRLMVAEQFGVSQREPMKRVMLTAILFIPAIAILFFAKTNGQGFQILWRYFGFTNQLVAVFALAMITVYLKAHKKLFLASMVPGLFYTFIVFSYISNAKIGFNLPLTVSYIIGVVGMGLFVLYTMMTTNKRGDLIRREDH